MLVYLVYVITILASSLLDALGGWACRYDQSYQDRLSSLHQLYYQPARMAAKPEKSHQHVLCGWSSSMFAHRFPGGMPDRKNTICRAVGEWQAKCQQTVFLSGWLVQLRAFQALVNKINKTKLAWMTIISWFKPLKTTYYMHMQNIYPFCGLT